MGTVTQNGFLWMNPCYLRQPISLRVRNFNGSTLKVNDKMGSPIEIAVTLVWKITDCFQALFDVEDFNSYLSIQNEAVVQHLTATCPYDDNSHVKNLTSRVGGENVNKLLGQELHERLAPAGITIIEAGTSHLTYAPEIAHAMLQRQQAIAIVSARKQMVERIVRMVEMAEWKENHEMEQ